ncbi:glycosyltransferase family protein [Arthrobacter sp. Y-9]|uniref:glycosyltransferase family protein n=1 Tax=Arthrobacter sp. Y-9 TaxID=3039385 RepID=UPI00241EB273|nr:glycosyltransferase family protein [Arthrobacter sp. Y-9]WFR83088.1 glycosyltransferase family protein [Arthrobacter sp. Y-9]
MTIKQSPRVVAVIQARVGSSRLPGKVLRPLGGRPVLEWVVNAARRAEGIDEVVIATSSESGDDAIVEFASTRALKVIRGSEDDVLSRFLLAIEETQADAVVRLTADCPLLDSTVISQVVSLWRTDTTLDYVSTTQVRSLPRGLDVELATASALVRADLRSEPHHRAHVTSSLYEEGSEFSRAALTFTPRFDHYRVTLDTVEDAALLDALVASLDTEAPSWRDVVSVLDRNPQIVALNAHIEQKALTEG